MKSESGGFIEPVTDTFYTHQLRSSDEPADYCFITSVTDHFVYMLLWDRDSGFESCTTSVLNKHTSFQRCIRGSVKDEVDAIIADLELLD